MLFMNFSEELADTFRSKFREVAEQYRGDGISFLLGEAEDTQAALQVNVLLVINLLLVTF